MRRGARRARHRFSLFTAGPVPTWGRRHLSSICSGPAHSALDLGMRPSASPMPRNDPAGARPEPQPCLRPDPLGHRELFGGLAFLEVPGSRPRGSGRWERPGEGAHSPQRQAWGSSAGFTFWAVSVPELSLRPGPRPPRRIHLSAEGLPPGEAMVSADSPDGTDQVRGLSSRRGPWPPAGHRPHSRARWGGPARRPSPGVRSWRPGWRWPGWRCGPSRPAGESCITRPQGSRGRGHPSHRRGPQDPRGAAWASHQPHVVGGGGHAPRDPAALARQPSPAGSPRCRSPSPAPWAPAAARPCGGTRFPGSGCGCPALCWR